MTESLLQVQFANKTIDIYCEHHDLYHTIQRHLRHALSQNGASCATYFIKKTEDEQWTLQRDSITIVTATSILYLLESLYHDVTLTFTKLCNQHLLFHAAGVATRKSGILLCGASGSGKSTFTARLIADGYCYLSDELIALDKTGMQGWLRPIVLKSGSRFFWEKWLDKSAQQHMMLTSNGTAYIDPTLIKPDSICRFSRPTQLVFPHYSPQQPTQLTRLSKADAAYQLMHLLINATALPQHGLDQVTALCKQIPAYHLIFSDLETAVSKLDTLVSK